MSAETPIQVNKEELEEIARAWLRLLELNPQIPAHAATEATQLAERLMALAAGAAAQKAAAQESSLRDAYLAWRAQQLPALSRQRPGDYVAVLYDPERGAFQAAGFGADPDAAVAAAAAAQPGLDVLPVLERL